MTAQFTGRADPRSGIFDMLSYVSFVSIVAIAAGVAFEFAPRGKFDVADIGYDALGAAFGGLQFLAILSFSSRVAPVHFVAATAIVLGTIQILIPRCLGLR